MLKELELEKFKTPDQFAQTEVERKALNWCAAYLRAVGKWEPTV